MGKNHGINVYQESWEQLTRNKAFEGYVPEEVCISLCQFDDIICRPIVKTGEYVAKGQVIGEPESEAHACVHASISGYVEEIFYHQRAPGICIPFVRIKKNKDQIREWYPFALDFDKEAVTKMMYQIGIHGNRIGNAKILIVNGFANEPYITSGYRLIMESPGKIVIGAILGAMAAGAESIYLCINEDAFDAVTRLKCAVQKYGQNMGNRRPIWVLPMKRRYPYGNEKVIQRTVMGKEKGTAAVVSIAEMTALYDGIYDGEPWTKVGVTVSGKIPYPKNLWVPIGTNVKELIDYCGGMSEAAVVIYGGPLGGHTIDETEHWICRDSAGLLVLELEDIPISPCIHCGMCRDVCPQGLKPDVIEKKYLKGENALSEFDASDCIRCGLCSYICPSGRRLTEYVGQVQKGRIRKEGKNSKQKGAYIEIPKRSTILKQLNRLEHRTQSPPHIHRRGTIYDVMRNSIYGLAPLIIGVMLQEPMQAVRVFAMLVVGAIIAGLTEYFWQELNGKYHTVRDGSAIFTGILLTLLFSIDTPLWKVGLASVVAILLGKQCFGGIGYAPIHPVIVGKILFQPFETAMIEPMWYAAIFALGWMLISRMIPWKFPFIYILIVGIMQPMLLSSALIYISAAYFVWSYETMAPTRSCRWIFTLIAAGLTVLFSWIGMGSTGIYFAIAFSDLLVPVMVSRSVKRV